MLRQATLNETLTMHTHYSNHLGVLTLSMPEAGDVEQRYTHSTRII